MQINAGMNVLIANLISKKPKQNLTIMERPLNYDKGNQ